MAVGRGDLGDGGVGEQADANAGHRRSGRRGRLRVELQPRLFKIHFALRLGALMLRLFLNLRFHQVRAVLVRQLLQLLPPREIDDLLG